MNDDHSDELRDEAGEPGRASSWRSDLLASIVVFLVALPLCMGIAIASGVPVAAGLITGIVGGIVVGTLAGSPLQVSGPAAGLTVLVLALVQQHGREALGPIVLLAGGMQVLAGILRLGPWFRAVSPAVIHGMLAGIGVLIFAGQFHVMLDDAPRETGLKNLMAIPEAISKGWPLPEWGTDADRRFRSTVIRKLGQIHESQELVTDAVHARVSDHSTPAEAEAQARIVAPLAARQKEVSQGLDHLAALFAAREKEPGASPLSETTARLLERARAATGTAFEDLDSTERNGTIEKGHDAADRPLARVRTSQTEALASVSALLTVHREHAWAGKVGLATIAILLLWQGLAPARCKLVPGALLAVAFVSAVAAMLHLPVKMVELPAKLTDGVELVSFAVFKDVPLKSLLEGACLIAVVASAETLLCAAAVDQMHTGPRTNFDRELTAQGVGNLVCGILGGLPMTGVIVRSAANLQAGAKTRVSTIFHGVWLLVFVAALSSLLQLIPTSCLAGLLVYTGAKLVDVRKLSELWAFSRAEAVICLVTMGTIVATDLLTGVIAGIILSAVKLLFTFSNLRTHLECDACSGRATLSLEGSATVFRLPALAAELEKVPRGCEVHVDIERLSYIDHGCLTLLTHWSKQHVSSGGRVIVDWDGLHAAFREAGSPGELTARSHFERDDRAAGRMPEKLHRPLRLMLEERWGPGASHGAGVGRAS